MKDRIQSAFSQIHADDALIINTAAYLNGKLTKRRHVCGRSVFRKLAATFASLAVLVAGIFAYNLYYTADAYVSIDVNPSVELTLNRFNTVIGTYGFNEDGTAILDKMNLRGEKYDEAVGLILSAIGADGYLAEDALVSMTVQAANGDREQTLYSSLQSYLDEQFLPVQTMVETEVFVVTAEVRGHAHGCGMSPAKYLAIQELMEVDEEATVNAYSNFSIVQIRRRTQECHNSDNIGADDIYSEPSQSHGNGHKENNGHGYRGGRNY